MFELITREWNILDLQSSNLVQSRIKS